MEGIVLKTIDYKETDRLCYLVTDMGPMSVRVKKARLYKSKNHSFCNLLTISEFNVYKAPILGLKDFNVLDNLYYSKNDYYKMMISINILELAYLEHNISTIRLYNFVKELLVYINNNDDYLKAYLIYLIKMLKIFGILPDLNSSMNPFSFITLDSSELEVIRKMYYGNINESFTVNLSLVLKLISYYEAMGLAYFNKIKNVLKEKI